MTKRELKSETEEIAARILMVRGQRVLLDSDLAELYGVSASRLNEQVRRNRNRFPEDFTIRIPVSDLRALRSQFATLEKGRGRHRKYAAFGFTEHGAIMVATVLNSPRAVEMSVYVVRAFVKLRHVISSHGELASKLAALEKSVVKLDARTRRQFEEVYAAIRALMRPPTPKARPIGFTANINEGE